jgi:hypothetical protein
VTGLVEKMEVGDDVLKHPVKNDKRTSVMTARILSATAFKYSVNN